jgi:hypothetical protein
MWSPVAMKKDDRPADGDVLITIEKGHHFLSVIPHHHRLSVSQLPAAVEIALSWAAVLHVGVWLAAHGRTERIAAA